MLLRGLKKKLASTILFKIKLFESYIELCITRYTFTNCSHQRRRGNCYFRTDPWTEESGRLQSMGSRSGTQVSNWTTTAGDALDTYHMSPLQCHCHLIPSICKWKLRWRGKANMVKGIWMAPQKMPLWHKDYPELKTTKKEQTQEELSVLPFLPKSRI